MKTQASRDLEDYSISIIIPCFNEESAVSGVIRDFKKYLPGSKIYVYDNASKDGTVEEALRQNVIVRHEKKRGKGNVMRRAFSDIESDIYVIADGDGTYDLSKCEEMINSMKCDHLDMVVGVRQGSSSKAHRFGHESGNRAFNFIVRYLFGGDFVDVFSGLRIFSRRFVKSFPSLSDGFEFETEVTIHALQLKLPCLEIPICYRERELGTESKLRTIRDGLKILWRIFILTKQVRPFLLFFSLSIGVSFISLWIGMPVLFEFFESGLVERLPTAVAAASIMVIAVFLFVSGIILDGVAYMQNEHKRLSYLATSNRRSEERTMKN